MDVWAVIYARYSPRPGNPEDILSNRKQIERCREYCEAKGYRIKLIETDEAKTGLDKEGDPDPGKAVLNRPGLLRALDALSPGNVLVVRWRHRLARDPYILTWIKRRAEKKKAKIEAADEANAEGMAAEMVETTLAIVAKWHAIQIGIDTTLAMARKRKAGQRICRADRLPFGLMEDPANPGHLIDCPAEKKIIAKILFKRIIEKKGYRVICGELDAEKIPRRDKTWKNAHGNLRAIVKRWEASGEFIESAVMETLKSPPDRATEGLTVELDLSEPAELPASPAAPLPPPISGQEGQGQSWDWADPVVN